jgi:anti-sigma-K factor RskA
MTMHEDEDRREQAALFVLGALPPDERTDFEAHVAGCAECAAEVRSLAAVPTILARAVPQIDPSPALRQRVLQSIAAVDVRSAQAARPAAGRGRALAPWLAAAAAILISVGLGGYALDLRARVGALETRLRDALARADAADRVVADARRVAADAESRVAVLAAPDVSRVDLAGQPAAPQASGRAYWSRSRGLVFTASSLPPLPPGRAYQLWVLTAQTPPISNGWLLRPDASGGAAAMFTTPPDLPVPTAMAVTIEPDGGVPAPTGAMYLVGRVAPSQG